MSRLHRFLLLCLLSLALPLQGFAAATRAPCGMEAMPAAIDEAPCEGEDMAMPMTPASHDQSGHKSSCSVCAACCVVAAPCTTFDVDFEAIAHPRVESKRAEPRLAFLTDGPDRPPRSSRA